MPTPGAIFLARELPHLALPAVAIYGGFHLLNEYKLLRVSSWVKWAAIVAYYPLSVVIRRILYKIWMKRDSARLGGQMVPKVKGKKVGNLDIVELLYSMPARKAYIAADFEVFVKELGNIVDLNVLWDTNIVTIEPDHIKQILATEFNNFEKGEDWIHAAKSLLGDGVFNADGDMWKFHRSMTRPFFTKERISHFELFARHADEAVALMKQRLREGVAIDIQDVFARFTLDSATEFLYGRNVHSLRAGLPYPSNHPLATERVEQEHPSNIFAQAFTEAQTVVWVRTAMWKIWPLMEVWENRTERSMKVVRQFIDPIVEDAIQVKNEKREKGMSSKEEIEDGETLLDHLVKYTDDEKLIKEEIINITVAGRDTTASLLTLSTYLLSQHPDVLKRLREEILTTAGPSRNPTYDDIRDMKYLRAVLNETLRLFPPVPFDVRRNINSTTFSNPDPTGKPFYIPPKTTVSYSAFLMQRRTDLWGPDAQSFDPDRFLDARLSKYLIPNPFIFVPFNAGPRICLGQQFAYNEASFMLIRLLQSFGEVVMDEESQPEDSMPPKWWKECKEYEGRKKEEKVMLRAHLTLYAYKGLWVKMREAKNKEVV